MALYRESFIFRIETGDPGMFWTGHGDLLLPADSVLSDPEIARGGGDLLNIPDVEQLINGIAERIEVNLSGISDETLRYANEESAQIAGAPVYIGRIQFDEDWQQAQPVEWEWTGEGRNLSVGSQDGPDGHVRSLTLRVGAGDTTRSRAPVSFFTDADQVRDFPDDSVFSHVGGLNAGTSRRWGPAS